MTSLIKIRIFGLAFVFGVILLLEMGLHSDVFGQSVKKEYDMVLLNQSYNRVNFMNEITGELLNNGTNTAKSVDITAIFYDNHKKVIGHESAHTKPSTIKPSDKSTFALQIDDETIKSNTDKYEITIKWQDENSFNYFTKMMGVDLDDQDDDGGGREQQDDDGDDGDGN